MNARKTSSSTEREGQRPLATLNKP